jgi:ABC-type transport system substrate-binding protein
MLQAQSADDIRKQNFELQKYAASQMYYVPVVTPVEYGARSKKLKGVVNTTGPTTYALGTETTLNLWLG